MTQAHYLELGGDACNRGRTHGGELRLQVKDCVEFHRGILGLEEDALLERAGLYERLIESYSPTLAQEIRGIAEGAGLPPAHLFAVNARSDDGAPIHVLLRETLDASSLESAGDMEENSRARWTRAEELLEGLDAASVDDVKRILSDRRDADAPICAPYQPLFGLELGTLCTAVMDLPARRLHLRMGADQEGEFQVYSL